MNFPWFSVTEVISERHPPARPGSPGGPPPRVHVPQSSGAALLPHLLRAGVCHRGSERGAQQQHAHRHALLCQVRCALLLSTTGRRCGQMDMLYPYHISLCNTERFDPASLCVISGLLLRFCMAAVSYGICRGDSLPQQQQHQYIPSSLYKKVEFGRCCSFLSNQILTLEKSRRWIISSLSAFFVHSGPQRFNGIKGSEAGKRQKIESWCLRLTHIFLSFSPDRSLKLLQ